MIALVWVTGLVVISAIIMYGIYRIVRIFDDNTLELRELKKKHTETEAENLEFLVKITRLEAELRREKERIHDADQ